jgi:transketolase
VSLAVQAHEKLLAEGKRSRVVSILSLEIFEHQNASLSRHGPNVYARVAVEQASSFGWERYAGKPGRLNCTKTFGASAPLKELQRRFGFEPDQIIEAAKALLNR